MKRQTYLSIVLLLCFLQSCGLERNKQTVINVSLIPWIGNYPLYFAVEKDIPKKFGTELRLLETLSAQDFRRANIKGHVDAFASSLMELTISNDILEHDIEIVAFLNFSNGADVIISDRNITSLAELENKVVGFDWRSLEHYFLNIALRHENVEDTAYIHRQVDQVSVMELFNEGKLDGYVSYPPISTTILKDDSLHVIFDSSKVPYQIIDVLAIKKGRGIKKDVLFQIWAETVAYIEAHPQEYLNFVAKFTGIQTVQIGDELENVVLINEAMQTNINRQDMVSLLKASCEILDNASESCESALQKLHYNNKLVLEE